MSPSADHVAVALVAAFKAGKSTARLLLSPHFDEPRVTILADAALVLAERFSVRNRTAARLCAIRQPARMVAVKMALSQQNDRRLARQKQIAHALDAYEAKHAPESQPALIKEPETAVVSAAVSAASPDKDALIPECSKRSLPDWMVPRTMQRGDPAPVPVHKPAIVSAKAMPAHLQPRALSADLRAQIDAKIAAGQVTHLPTGHAAGISSLEMAMGRVAPLPIPEGGWRAQAAANKPRGAAK